MEIIKPEWAAPSSIFACTTTTACGNLKEPIFREALRKNLALPTEPLWLTQVHGNVVHTGESNALVADARYTNQANRVCAIMTADCLPILLCTLDGQEVAAVHGGWRGLAVNILAKTLVHFQAKPLHILAWLGPAICPQHYEIDTPIYEVFVSQEAAFASCFTPTRPGHYLADLYAIARLQLQALGVTHITGGHFCTFEDARFYSYRRSPQTGRMASLIYIASPAV